MSRETILDYWLSAWVAASLVVLRRTRGFENRYYSLLLGLILAFGLLTKWLFAAFLASPLLYLFIRQRLWKKLECLLNYGGSLLVAGLLAGIWYVPNLPTLMRYFSQNSQIGALEGEPPVFSLQSFIYYLRLLEGYQFFAILFSLLVVSCVVAIKRVLIHDTTFLCITVFGGWFIVTLLRTKDPRFTMPLLGLLAAVPAAWIQSWPRTWALKGAKVFLTLVLCLQAYMANFGISWLPDRVVLAEGYQGSLRWTSAC
jgi:4-amino-4-deoxy-L-arabinose transferase-like glycosyltransferase